MKIMDNNTHILEDLNVGDVFKFNDHDTIYMLVHTNDNHRVILDLTNNQIINHDIYHEQLGIQLFPKASLTILG